MVYNRFANWQRTNPGPATVTLTGDVSGALTVTPGQPSSAPVSLAPAPGQPAGDFTNASLTVGIDGRIEGSDSGATPITVSGSAAAGQLAIFNSSTSISGGNLSGDVTTSGSTATTLKTVNSNVGTFGDAQHVAQVTLNAKGLATAASSVAIIPQMPSSLVMNLPASPPDGLLYLATDCTLTAITGLGLAPTGGGGNKVPVYSASGGWLML